MARNRVRHDALVGAAGRVLRSERADVPLLRLSTNLSLLPGGRPDANPMAGLTSDRMRALLEQFNVPFAT